MSVRALSKMPPLTLSFLGHFTVALGLGLLFLSRTSPVEEVPFDVLEAPVPALAPLPVQAQPKKQTQPERRQVFGVTRKSLQSDTGPEVKAGNTVAKVQDNEKLRPEDEDALPIPTDEYLVSEMPQILGEFRIPYPEEAKRKGVQGTVLMDLLIDPAGNVRQAKLIEGPGSGLNEAAQAAVMRMRFKPAKVKDQPVAVRIRYGYKFVLEK